jgi:hypothetical protein
MGDDDEKFQRNAELTEANANAIAMFRKDMAASEEKRESKLNGMTVILNNVVKVLDQITYRMDVPQLGISDRLNGLDESQKTMAKILGEVQAVLGPLVEASKQTRKWVDYVIGGVVIYTLTRLLPYIGQLLQK